MSIARRLLGSAPAWLLVAAYAWRFAADIPVTDGLVGLALAVAAVFLAVRVPAAAAGLAVAGAAYVGGYAVLAAAPAVLLLGYRATADFRAGPAPGRWRWLASAALLAALATVPFADLAYERRGGGGGGDPTARRLRPGSGGAAAPADGARLGDGLATLLRRLVRSDSNPRWWLLALILAVLSALLIVVWLVLRRRRRTTGPAAASAVERLEAVGRRIGRRRRPDEGVLGYASALAERAGDRRLSAAGPEVSALVYRSRAASGARVEQVLGALEASPPPRPSRRRSLPELVGRVRSRVGFPVAVAGMTAAVVIIGAVGVVVPRLSRLSTDDAGPGTLWTEPPSEVEQWWSCNTFDGQSEARAGVDHLTLERSATRTRYTVGTTLYEVDEGIWDGESSMAHVGEEAFAVDSDLVHPWRPFADLDRVLERFSLTDPVVTTHRDPTGATFTRYESMPLTPADRGPIDGEQVGARRETNVVWVLDVWLDGSGRPVRLRQMVDGDPGRWEWLLLDEPTGDSTPPSCGLDAAPAPGLPRQGPWLGAEPWDPTLEVPLQVAYDADGHPYDLTRWSIDGEWSTLGSLRSSGGTVTITGLELLDAGTDPSGWSETVTVAPGTTVRVEHYAAEAGDGHRMVLSGPGGAYGGVVAWRLLDEIDLIELTSVVMVIPPAVDSERIETAYAEMADDGWAGTPLDLDDDGTGDLLVLGGYGGLTRVYAGEDATGRMVELASLTEGLPWRVLGLPGEAPADVLSREQALAECVAGARPTGPDGVCQRS